MAAEIGSNFRSEPLSGHAGELLWAANVSTIPTFQNIHWSIESPTKVCKFRR
jgi:hypothetical protein